MFYNRLRGPIVVVLLCLPSFVLSDSKVVIRPHFDESIVPQRSFYPYKVLRHPKIALVLSGGGARGVAQIGVLKVFERHNIPIDFVSATSLGAIIGGLYASGYTPAEIESLALNTDWDEVLSLTEDTKRTALFVDQKLATDRSFLSLRFEGLEPVIPSALSSGQPLTNFLSTQTLQALYHPNPSFDDLKVRFRVITTDLISGKRVIIKEGSLAEALRATAGVPLLFNPIEKDSMKLVDGGLVSNIPADVAKAEGYDIIIAVNSTSGLRNEEELKAPWQTADQIMGIMMQLSNQEQLKLADVVITPQVGRHLSSDFQGLDSLIAEGELAAESKLDDIIHMYEQKAKATDNKDNHVLTDPIVETSGDGVPDSLWKIVRRKAQSGKLTTLEIRHHVDAIYALGDYRDVYAEVFSEEQPSRVNYTTVFNPRLQSVEFEGCKLIAPETLQAKFAPLVGKPVNHRSSDVALDNVLRLYRAKGYSLARIEATSFDAATGVLHIVINEGVIHKIDVQGGVRTKDYVVLREFPMEEGEVFDINKANRGVININGTTLFENVYLEVSYLSKDPILTIRLQERPSQLIRFGLRADDERNLQGSLDVRDENLGGTGTDIGLNVAGGSRNHDVELEYKALRLFNTYLTFGVSAFYSVFDTHIYGDAEQTRLNHWERVRIGEYRDMRYGGKLVFGAQLERIGNTTVELSLQNVRIKSKENAESLEQRYRLSRIRFGTVVDTKDSYPFPTSGIGLNISYEFAIKGLGSEVSYNALKVVYESYTTWRNRHTLHPRITIGFADRTMPLGEQFRLGGRELMFGTREDDRRGRQFLLLNIEYRYRFPIRILFDTFLRLRYDLGSISTVPEEIKFATLRHGVGAELAFDTPVGQAAFGAGRSFFFGRELPNNPTQWGPVLFYFVIGYQL